MAEKIRRAVRIQKGTTSSGAGGLAEVVSTMLLWAAPCVWMAAAFAALDFSL